MTPPTSGGPPLEASQIPVRRTAQRARSTLIMVAGALALVAAVASAYYFSMRPVTLRIAVGPPNSDDVRVVQALAQAFNRSQSHVRLRTVITDGARASATVVGTETTDLAVVRGDSDLPKNARAVATLRKNVAVIWVPATREADDKAPTAKNGGKASDKVAAKAASKAANKTNGKSAAKPPIDSIEQLAGHRVGVIGRTPANADLLRMILAQYAINPDRVEIVQFSVNGLSEALRQARADAFLAVGPLNSKITADAIAATSAGGAPTFLAIDAADAIALRLPVFDAAEIPAGNFGGAPARPADEIKTIGFNHHIVARQSLSDVAVAALTRQIFAVRQEIVSEFPQSATIETPDTDKDAAIPAHPGAAAYVDGEEKSFLDRYSDYIWWSLMGLSAFGSLGAWLASFLRRDERTANTSLRTRLLEMLAAARLCNSIEELDRMQAEGDDILRSTLDCYESGAIEDGALTAFNIALEQFHNAVADRKTWLAALPPQEQRSALVLRV